MRTYYFISRLASPFIKSVFYFYSQVTGIPRVRVMVESEEGEILLVQAWPDTSSWTLPGGGVKRDETAKDAAARELREETGMHVRADDLRMRATFHTWGHQETLYSVTEQKSMLSPFPPNRWEVRRAGWFMPDSLPKISSATQQALTEVATRG